MIKKFLLVLLILFVSFSIFASDGEIVSKDGFNIDVYLTGGVVHGNGFASGIGSSLNLRYADINYGVYLDLEYSFIAPKDYIVELFVEPGIQVSWDFFKRKNNLTSLSLGFGFAMDTGIMATEKGVKANIFPYAIVVKPMLMTNFRISGGYFIGVGLFYQMAAYPVSTNSVFNGFGFNIKVL